MKTKKKKSVSTSSLIKKAQKVFNAYIRNRDSGLPCIACGQNKELQAGHYVPVKNSSFLRFHEWNVHGECAGCNLFDRFHLIGYKERLIEKIGVKAVNWLEKNRRTVKKWSKSELEEIIKKYEKF